MSELIVTTGIFYIPNVCCFFKVILAARSEYFRALLYGGMKESSQQEIELMDTPPEAFKILLKYVYAGEF
jgi:BTB/POZ domain